MGVSWAFVVLLVYPALQLPMLWIVVRYFGLRNDDGPWNPVGYSVHPDRADEGELGRCRRCGLENDPAYEYCRDCLAGLSPGPA